MSPWRISCPDSAYVLQVVTRPEMQSDEMKMERENYNSSIEDMQGEMCVAVLTGFERGVCNVACSPDGGTIAAAAIDKNSPIALWSTQDVLQWAKNFR